MTHLLRITDLKKEAILEIFHIADEIKKGAYKDLLRGKSVIMFFPDSSIRTRVTFEKGIYLLGGQPILFPPKALDKKEDIKDVMGYLSNWADIIVVRHSSFHLLEKMCRYSKAPVINAMTDVNHPCEILCDLYSLSKMRTDFLKDHYLFLGGTGNIGLAWKEAGQALGLNLIQCCPKGFEMEGIVWLPDLKEAIKNRDIICTDPILEEDSKYFAEYQITKDIMDKANPGAVLNPCPPFCRGGEVSQDAIDSDYFVGYAFKKNLLEIQQAVMIYCLSH